MGVGETTGRWGVLAASTPPTPWPGRGAPAGRPTKPVEPFLSPFANNGTTTRRGGKGYGQHHVGAAPTAATATASRSAPAVRGTGHVDAIHRKVSWVHLRTNSGANRQG